MIGTTSIVKTGEGLEADQETQDRHQGPKMLVSRESNAELSLQAEATSPTSSITITSTITS